MNFIFATSSAANTAGSSPTTMILLLVGMFAVMYFVMIRPQKKRQKEEKEMRNAVVIGDEITTIGGICGRIVTGDVFVNDRAVKQDLIERFAPSCTEMEGAAIAHASYVNGTPFLIIRTMSDSADDNADTAYDNFIEAAARQSASIVLKMLELAEEEN